ncbi:MAG: GNAT family N-acetyltransferase [archaeon]|nr:GNAT family N-acetyltransferase [archaeon]
MEIRVMRPGDENGAYSVMYHSLDQYFTQDVIGYFMMQWPAGQIVALDFTGRVIGYLAGARLQNRKASIHLFCVDSQYRGRGIGSSMLQRFRQAAIMEGLGTIQLEVRDTNVSAISFYRRHGFVTTENLPGFYNDGGDGIRMELSLFRNAPTGAVSWMNGLS